MLSINLSLIPIPRPRCSGAEDKHGYIAHGRRVFERAVEFFGEEHVDERLFVAFARFEEMQKEVGGEDQSPREIQNNHSQ
jgi:hypothetical protein